MRPHKYFKALPLSVKKHGLREVCQGNKAGKLEYEARRTEMWMRQKGKCAICEEWMDENACAFDHQNGRGFNGGIRDDRTTDERGYWMNAALCHKCNGNKGSKRYHWENGKYVPNPSRLLAKEVA